MTTRKYAFLLDDPDIKRWHDGLACSSTSTAVTYLGSLGLFLERVQLAPAGFLALAPRKRDDLMADHITGLYRAGKSKAAMKSVKAAVASWLDHQGERFTRRFRFPTALVPTDASQFCIPTQDRYRSSLDASDPRERLAQALVGQAGLRPGILGNCTGTAGLQFKHLPEARLTSEGIEFECIPTMIRVPAHLNKVRHEFFTFLGPEGCQYLAADAKRRLQAGENLTLDSAILPPTRTDAPFMHTGSVSQLIRGPLRRAGIREPPYILRSYFGNRCLMAQSNGLLHDWKEFMMGHKGSISAVYAVNKGLPPDTVEAMRAAYERAQEYLETRQTTKRRELWLEVVHLLLDAGGVPKEALQGLDLTKMDSDELVALFREHTTLPKAGIARQTQRIIQAGELEDALGNGWRVTIALTDGRFIVES
jgi:hypothetical protein